MALRAFTQTSKCRFVRKSSSEETGIGAKEMAFFSFSAAVAMGDCENVCRLLPRKRLWWRMWCQGGEKCSGHYQSITTCNEISIALWCVCVFVCACVSVCLSVVLCVCVCVCVCVFRCSSV